MRKQKRSILLARQKRATLAEDRPPEPWALAPDDLRDQVRRTFASLGEPDSKLLRQRLLSGLAQAGVDLGLALFILGIPAKTFDDLSPSDLGKLLRYVRINGAVVREAAAGLLAEVLGWKDNLAPGARTVKKAA